jgi:ankyrin repeat protein
VCRETVVRVVLNSQEVNQQKRDARGFNCLHYAVQHGHLAVVKCLKKEETPYIASNDGTTCLHIAVRKGYTQIVDFLLEKPATQFMKAKLKLLKKATWLENIVKAENKDRS